MMRRQSLVALIFVAPFLVIFGAYTLIPTILAAVISVTDITTMGLRNPFDAAFVGIANFTRILRDPIFLQSMRTTLVVVVTAVPLTMALGLALAIALNKPIRHFRGIFRGGFYLPVVVNMVAIGVIWKYAFSDQGLINSGLESWGMSAPNWLGDPHWALPTVIALGVWRNFGFCMVLFLAGLQTIPEDLYEAAKVDGASRWQSFMGITLPMLRPTTLLVSILMTIFFLQVFDEPYVLTGGGPLNTTTSVALYTYKQFSFGNINLASAASFLLLLVVGAITALQLIVLRPKN